jgi:hypothetical protein
MTEKQFRINSDEQVDTRKQRWCHHHFISSSLANNLSCFFRLLFPGSGPCGGYGCFVEGTGKDGCTGKSSWSNRAASGRQADVDETDKPTGKSIYTYCVIININI